MNRELTISFQQYRIIQKEYAVFFYVVLLRKGEVLLDKQMYTIHLKQLVQLNLKCIIIFNL